MLSSFLVMPAILCKSGTLVQLLVVHYLSALLPKFENHTPNFHNINILV